MTPTKADIVKEIDEETGFTHKKSIDTVIICNFNHQIRGNFLTPKPHSTILKHKQTDAHPKRVAREELPLQFKSYQPNIIDITPR